MDIRLFIKDKDRHLRDDIRLLIENISTAYPNESPESAIEGAYLDGVISYGTSVELYAILREWYDSVKPLVKNLTGDEKFTLIKVNLKRCQEEKRVALSEESKKKNENYTFVSICKDVWYIRLLIRV